MKYEIECEAVAIVASILIFGFIVSTGWIEEFFDDDSILDPTFAEMKEFIENDCTEQMSWVEGVFTCYDFSNRVLNNAKLQNIRAGRVHLDDSHAIVCFDTVDEGMWFLEPQNDGLFSSYQLNKMKSRGYYNFAVSGLKDYEYLVFSNWYISQWNNEPVSRI